MFTGVGLVVGETIQGIHDRAMRLIERSEAMSMNRLRAVAGSGRNVGKFMRGTWFILLLAVLSFNFFVSLLGFDQLAGFSSSHFCLLTLLVRCCVLFSCCCSFCLIRG